MSDCQQQPARVPSARKSCAATLHKHELFIHGGRGKGDMVLADAAIFDLKTPRWSVSPSGRGKLQDAEQTNDVRQRAGSQFMSLLHLLQPLIVRNCAPLPYDADLQSEDTGQLSAAARHSAVVLDGQI